MTPYVFAAVRGLPMRYWKSAVVSLLTGVMIAMPVVQPVAIYADTVLTENGAVGSAQDDGPASGDTGTGGSSDAEEAPLQDEEAARAPESDGAGEGAAAADMSANAQEDASADEQTAPADDASEANTMASRSLVENSWRYENGQRIEGLDDESAPSADFMSRAMDPLPEGVTAQGIDVSEFQGKIDWDAVKAAGVDFAILRIGYGDQNAGGADEYFERNVQECERLGIRWGAYLYSYAVNTKEAADEAAHALSAMEGLTPDLPIYYDMEDTSTLAAKDKFADIAQVFCSKVEAAGFDAGVYASASWWKKYLTSPVFDNWSKWSAQYYKVCEHPSDPDAWQYTSEGRVPGISGNVDVNYAYEGLVPPAGTWVLESGEWYFRLDDGANLMGWLNHNGKTYWLDPDNNGSCAYGLVSIGNKRYFFDPSSGGALSHGWVHLDGRIYYADGRTGAFLSGWHWLDNQWYLFIAADGFAAKTGWYSEGSQRYFLNQEGIMARGWLNIDGNRYYFNQSGVMQRTWQHLNGDWYYFGLDGMLAVGWFKDGGSRWFYSGQSGRMLKGWHFIEGEWYYLSENNGTLASGWLFQNGVWYYMSPSGVMARGTVFDGSAWSSFNSSGRWLGYCEPGWMWEPGGWHWLSMGGVPQHGWHFISGAWYYLGHNSQGTMLIGWHTIDGVRYYFDANGVMATGWKIIDGRSYYFSSSGAFLAG